MRNFFVTWGFTLVYLAFAYLLAYLSKSDPTYIIAVFALTTAVSARFGE